MSTSPNKSKPVNGGNPAAGDAETQYNSGRRDDVIDLTREEEHENESAIDRSAAITGSMGDTGMTENLCKHDGKNTGSNTATAAEENKGSARCNNSKSSINERDTRLSVNQSCQANVCSEAASRRSNKDTPVSAKKFIHDIIKETVHQTQMYHCHHQHCMRPIPAHLPIAMPSYEPMHGYQNPRNINTSSIKSGPQMQSIDRGLANMQIYPSER